MVDLNTPLIVNIDISNQVLQVQQNLDIIFSAQVATAKNGAGERYGSEQTPRGWHLVRAKIGTGEPENRVFVGRRATNELYSEELSISYPDRDWILTRIIWLSGLELGFNRLGDVDTMRRYIYIHGCPDNAKIGEASSHGCIRMRNKDVIPLFDMLNVGTKVLITE